MKKPLGSAHMSKEGSGVSTGLSERKDMATRDDAGPGTPAMSRGNKGYSSGGERVKPIKGSSVSSKGKSFDIC